MRYFDNSPFKTNKIKDLFINSDTRNTNNSDEYLSVVRDVGVIKYSERGDSGNKTSDSPEKYKMVDVGDLVINPMNVTIGSVGVSEYSGCLSGVYLVLKPKTSVNSKYYHYLFHDKGFQKYLKTISYGIMEIRESLNKTEFFQFKIPKPSVDEQEEIVSYLNKKTTQIDKLITKIEQNIDLLKEQRNSLINEVVTKGLNTDVEMMESGVGWIGKIPNNWEIKKLKYLVKHIKEKNTPGEEDIKISPEYVESDTGICFNQYSEHSGDGYKFIHGDILLNKLRIYLKKFLLVDFEGYSIGEMIVLRTEKKDHSEFIFNCLFSDDLIGHLNSLSTGVKVPRVSPGEILSTKFPLPPTEEILKINEFIKHNNVKINNQISIEEKRIKLLKEYKQSLISEVVTGKKRIID